MKMALVPVSTESSFGELGMNGSVESLGRLLDSQKKLFYSQVDQLHRVVVTHCKLTGANPLSQEMAAGALSIKIGKKPRDLLNPKAVKYMQSVFAIKDTIKKKETREISALCGVTVTQVKDFFSGQRSKVRKLVRLAREKAVILDESKATNEGCSANPEATPLCAIDAPLSAVSIINIGEPAQIPASDGSLPAIQHEENAPVSSVDAKPIQAISPSSQEGHVPGIDEDDKKILETIFNLMRKEETFSGQVKLMEWILQINNSAVLVWFSTKGSITILATWLSQAAIEEQTTVLYIIFKVLCHLPLHKALPAEISTILQTVNKLRFYRTPDISNRARILLSRWSKMLVRSQALRYPSIMNSKNGVQREIIRKQRINEILSGEFWQSKIGISENSLALTANSGNDRSGSRQTTKLLTTSCDSSTRNQGQNASVKIKERRTVRLVEQIDQKPAVRIAQVGRAAPSNHSRPMSADDIQKAKMRAMYMQHKYGKADESSNENKKIEQDCDPTTPQSKKLSPLPNSVHLDQVIIEEEKKAEVLAPGAETITDTELAEAPQEELLDRLKAIQVQWLTPLEMKIDSSWRVGRAESSKELGVQTQRIRREKEIFYPSAFEIPPNPKEPWDIEMDFDDSLTPEIPIEQPPDTDAAEDSADHPVDDRSNPESTAVAVATLSIASSFDAAAPVSVPALPVASSGSATEPDLELLAALLKNPELVFALTSGQGKNLTNNERVALLDMIKHSNVLLTGAVNGMSGASLEKPKETIPASLPSPTPPSDAERATGWRSAFPTTAKAPLPAFHSLPTQNHAPPSAPAFQSSKMPQGIITANAASQSAPFSGFSSLSSSPSLPLHFLSSGYAVQQRPNAESSLPLKNYIVSCPAAAVPSPTPASFRHDAHILNPPSIPSLSSQHTFPPTQKKPQVLAISEPSATMFLPNPNSWTWGDANVEWRDKMPESSTQIPNAAEIFVQNQRFGVIDVTQNDVYPRHQGQSTTGREDIAGRSLHPDSWSPESTPMRSSDLRHGHGRSYADSRSEQGWNHNRQGWSRRRPGHRSQHRSSGGSGGKWRDRDRDRRR